MFRRRRYSLDKTGRVGDRAGSDNAGFMSEQTGTPTKRNRLVDAVNWAVEHGALWIAAAFALNAFGAWDGLAEADQRVNARFSMFATIVATQCVVVLMAVIRARRSVRTPLFAHYFRREIVALVGVGLLATAGVSAVATYEREVRDTFGTFHGCLGADGQTVEVVRDPTASCSSADAQPLAALMHVDWATDRYVTATGAPVRLHRSHLLTGRAAERAYRHQLIPRPDRPLRGEAFAVLLMISLITHRFASAAAAVYRAGRGRALSVACLPVGFWLLLGFAGGEWPLFIVPIALCSAVVFAMILSLKQLSQVALLWPTAAAAALMAATSPWSPSGRLVLEPLWFWAPSGWRVLVACVLFSGLFAYLDLRVASLPTALGRSEGGLVSGGERSISLFRLRKGERESAGAIAIPLVSPTFRVVLALIAALTVFADQATNWRGVGSWEHAIGDKILFACLVAVVLSWRAILVLSRTSISTTVGWRRRCLRVVWPGLAAASIPLAFAGGQVAFELDNGVAAAEVSFCESVSWSRNLVASHEPNPGFCERVMSGRPERRETSYRQGGIARIHCGFSMDILGNVAVSRVPPPWFMAVQSALVVFAAMQMTLMIATLRTGRRVRWRVIGSALFALGAAWSFASSGLDVAWTLEAPPASALARPSLLLAGLGAMGLAWIRRRSRHERRDNWFGVALLFVGAAAGLVPLAVGLLTYDYPHWQQVTPFLFASAVLSIALFAPVQNACARIRAQPI